MNGEPACIGQSELFDSRSLNDHHEAKRICRTCPVILECAGLLRAAQEAATGSYDGGPQGTWAGRFIGEHEKPRGVRQPCGTERAYQQHKHYGEPYDEACRAAHAAHNRKAS